MTHPKVYGHVERSRRRDVASDLACADEELPARHLKKENALSTSYACLYIYPLKITRSGDLVDDTRDVRGGGKPTGGQSVGTPREDP